MKNAILQSTGALFGRRAGIDFPRIKDYEPLLRCDGFEIMYSSQWGEDTDSVARVFRSLSKPALSVHLSKQIGELISRNAPGDMGAAFALMEQSCEFAEKVGVKLGVLHLWGGIASDREIERNIKAYPRLAEIAGKHGLTAAVENIVCNTRDALTHMKTLYEAYGKDVCFTVDTRQAEFHKLLKETMEAEFLWENGLVAHVHIGDFAGERMEWEKLSGALHPGEGAADFDMFFSRLRAYGYTGMLALEANGLYEGGLDAEKLNGSLDRMRSGMAGEDKRPPASL